MKTIVAAGLSLSLIALPFTPLYSHCEIPCGIYNDQARIDRILEDCTTIEKSMQSIISLQGQKTPDYNQLIRWISNKEEHAKDIQHIVSQYFLNQRIKPVDAQDKKAYAKYQYELTLLHQILVAAMKSKQSANVDHVKKLRILVGDFQKSYMGDH